MPLTRTDALPYVSYAVDNALAPRNPADMPDNARLVGWQAGFEPLFVAVWSYLGGQLDDSDAEDIARDYLAEMGWFTDNDNPPDADYVL